VHITSDLAQTLRPTAVAIGNFDGLHLGHQKVLQPIRDSLQGVRTVLTFHPHPQEVLTRRPQLLLTPPAEKLDLLAQMGFEQVVLLPFTPAFACQPPKSLSERYLNRACAFAISASVGIFALVTVAPATPKRSRLGDPSAAFRWR